MNVTFVVCCLRLLTEDFIGKSCQKSCMFPSSWWTQEWKILSQKSKFILMCLVIISVILKILESRWFTTNKDVVRLQLTKSWEDTVYNLQHHEKIIPDLHILLWYGFEFKFDHINEMTSVLDLKVDPNLAINFQRVRRCNVRNVTKWPCQKLLCEDEKCWYYFS